MAAPGDLATAWYELFPRRDAVRARVRQLADSIDLARCAALAQLWLPPGEYTLPKLDLIWDSNAGSYVAEGRAFYNLYQGEGATCLQGDDAERVIAHELHHILAEPLRANRIEWRTEARHKSMRRVIRQMVSEGSALHCNAPAGFKAELWNDPGVKAALVADLQRTFLALDAGTMGEDRFRAWFDDSYHGRALAILEDFAHRRGDADPVALARTHAVDRPDLVHALGWWMVQTVSRGGQDPAAVHALVREPDWLLARYDAALTDSDPRLRLDPRVTQMAGH